ncbi:hypothetical protein EVG20_g3228 [Dentipellis fragilis]|uniref:mRNA cap guanine-N(7) methyltransferase n=1 Tax=Dentipellis fragilis TaxID=205917 RepID=A0A4Y9Z7C1_9AGAM|nr:hypothetical protein EVG20_g3228 [Dentipellis fragilis]
MPPRSATASVSRSPTLPARPPPQTKPIPYNPHRRTPASSVLVPLSPQEMQMYRDQIGAGTMRLSKRKRAEVDERDNDMDEQRRNAKRSRDVGLVVEHYNARPEVGVRQRRESPIIGLRNFNNWVKSVLITRFAHPALAKATDRGGGRGTKGRGKVLDMGCGKGGDLSKWAKARIREYVGVDIAAVSVAQAKGRYDSLMQNTRPPFAEFATLDCYTKPLTSALPLNILPSSLDHPDVAPFDVVSMQFCMHYAFESIEKARCMLENASRWLRKGGVFVGTIPNAEQLLQRLDALPPDTPSSDLSFGNSVYKIRFENRTSRPLYGHRYWFFLRDAVEDVPEYIVHWDNFVQLAAEYGFYPLYKREFHEVFEEHQEHPEFGPLMERMKVVDKDGESQMDEDQWEAVNIYIAFAMEKR